MVRINTKTRMTELRRVRRILISSKDVTGVTSEKSDAVKFAGQAKLRWRKTWKWGEQSHMLLTKQYYALYVVNKWSHSGSKVVTKMFKSVQQFVTKWKQSYWCQNHLYWPYRGGWRCCMASFAWKPFWICRRWSKIDDLGYALCCPQQTLSHRGCS